MGKESRGLVTIGVMSLIIVVGFGLTAMTEGIIAAACGDRPTANHPFAAIALLLFGDTSGYAVASSCEVPATLIRVVALALTLVVIAAIITGVVLYARYKHSDRAFVADLRRRDGFATGSEIKKNLSAKAVLRRAAQLRPGLGRKPVATDVGWPVGESRGQDVFVSIEDSVVLEGPPRSGKGFRILISAILDWSGPLVTTSTTNDNLTATYRHRQRRGDVHVFDPQGLSGISRTLRVSPITGCEDPLVATQRGAAIITGTALGSSGNNAEWAQASSTVLARLLHAAAVSGRTVEDLYDWGSSPMLAQAAVDILRTDGAPGWGDNLAALLAGDEKLLSSTWFGVQGAVAPLAVPQIRETLMPRPGDPVFSPLEFLSGENTLYLIGSASGASAMGGFLSAMLDDVVEVARKKALASAGSRLQTPLGLILDEIANMFRWAGLPRIMADGGGRGICTMVVLQALSQAETSWSRAEADTIWSAATAKILLGGASDVPHLRDYEALLGTRERRRTQRSWNSESVGHNTSEQLDHTPLMTIDEIRRMPQEVGLLTYRNRRAALLDLQGWIDRRDAAEIKAGKSGLEQEQQVHFATTLNAPLRPIRSIDEPAPEAVETEVADKP